MEAFAHAALHASAAAGLCAYVLVHVPISRLRRDRSPLGNLALAALAGGGFCFLLGLWAARAARLPAGDAAGLLLLSGIAYVGLAWCYFNFVNLNLSSLRFRLLRELRQAPEGLTEDEIVSRYNARQIVGRRLEQLAGGGHLARRNGRYFVGNRFLLAAFDVLEALKLAVLGHGSLLIQRHLHPGAPAQPLPLALRVAGIARIAWSYALFRFVLVGVLNTAFSYCGYSLLVLLGIPYGWALTLMTVAAQFWNFATTGRLVFGNRRRSLIFRFLAAGGSIYLVNMSTLTLLVEVFGVGELAAQAMLVPLVILVSFAINKTWVFRSGRDGPAA